ncbi:response regulator [Rhodocaloribacter sp.]
MKHAHKPCILTVEDNDHTRQLVSYWLKDTFDVRMATNPEEALSIAENQAFDLLMLDINLGRGHNGVDLLHALRKQPALRRTPALAFTAYAMPSDRKRLLEEGFNHYVSKPFTKTELHAAIDTALARASLAA